MSQLRDALRQAAADVPAYPVVEAAIARGRRRRQRVAAAGSAAAVLAVLALVATVIMPMLGLRPGPAAGSASDAVSLPERIGMPGLFTGDVTEAPGAASVVFGAGPDAVTVGATDDRYHRLDARVPTPGEELLLSPDGSLIATWTSVAIRVVDLRTGQSRSYRSGDHQASALRPAAWLPDGRHLVVLTILPDPSPAVGTLKQFSLLDLDRGTFDPFAQTTWAVAPPGFAVAVSPDGRRIAYQSALAVGVFDRTSRATTTFRPPTGEAGVLAGKGAWTPDGRSLAILHPDFEGGRWELRFVDPETGEERDRGDRPGMAGVGLIRLLGWNDRTGDPVVAGYHGRGAADVNSRGDGVDLPMWSAAEAVGVYELAPDGPVALVRPVDGINEIDVADSVLAAGRTRPGDPPWASSLPTLVAIAAGLVLLPILVAAAVVALRRPPR